MITKGTGGLICRPWDPIAKATTQATKSALDSSCHYWLTIDITCVGWLTDAYLGKQTPCGGTTFQRNPQLTT